MLWKIGGAQSIFELTSVDDTLQAKNLIRVRIKIETAKSIKNKNSEKHEQH